MNKEMIIDKSLDLIAFLLVAGFLFASGIGLYILLKCLYLTILSILFFIKFFIGFGLYKLGEMIINL